jgi:hypothetical protein
MMMRYVLMFSVLLLNGGCAQMEEIRQKGLAMQAGPPRDDDAQCQSFGAQPGTPAYINCRAQLASESNAEEASKRNMVAGYLLMRR